jgi:hypothetical protein
VQSVLRQSFVREIAAGAKCNSRLCASKIDKRISQHFAISPSGVFKICGTYNEQIYQLRYILELSLTNFKIFTFLAIMPIIFIMDESDL